MERARAPHRAARAGDLREHRHVERAAPVAVRLRAPHEPAHLDRFAADAVVFEHCWSNSTWTVPSYMSQLSGLYPWSHRTPDAEDGVRERLAPERVTLAEVFGSAGYRTAAFVDNPHVSAALGFAQGFEVFDDSAARISKSDHSGGARKVFADGLAWLETLGDGEPYLLFLQVLDVHGPYVPDAPWRGSFAGDGAGVHAERLERVALTNRTVFDAVPPYVAAPSRRAGPPSARVAVAALADAYDEEILQMDAALGELFQELESRGILDEAIVLVSADHGESLLEHHLFFRHLMPYEPVVHVPLVLRVPGAGAKRVRDPVQLVDLYPTLIELTGVGGAPQGLHGRSLAAAVARRPLEPRPLVCQGDLFDGQAALLGGIKLVELAPHPRFGPEAFGSYPAVRAWIAERRSDMSDVVIGSADLSVADAARFGLAELWATAEVELCVPRREVYRLCDDPGELTDLSGELPPELRADVDRLAGELARVRALSNAARAGGAAALAPAELDPDLQAELSDLGYAGG